MLSLRKSLLLALTFSWGFWPIVSADAQIQDFNTYNVENYPQTSGFSPPNWQVVDGGASAGDVGNSSPTFFYSPDNVLNKRITGTVNATTSVNGASSNEDDIFGLAVGFNPGDTSNTNANFLLIDWKGDSQDFNFSGGVHDLTGGTAAGRGLALSQVEGTPTADELWGKTNFATNPDGRVTELARGNTLSNTDYNDVNGGVHDFEILFEPHRIRVNVNGVEEINQTGSFADGRLALWENHQNQGTTFSNFEISDLTAGDLTPLPGPGPAPTTPVGNPVTSATNIDFNTYTQEDFPATSGFSTPNWVISPDGSAAGEIGNSYPTILRGQELVHGTRIRGTVNPTTNIDTGNGNFEDDIFGFFLGYNPGDANEAGADYLVIDWKGGTQDFNFSDPAGTSPEFQNVTAGTTAERGLALSRVEGVVTADELWGHTNFATNPDGRVTELARGNTLSNADYGTSPKDFEILYEPNRIRVLVDSVLQIDETGDFPEGNFAIFESHQSLGTTFSNFTIEPLVGGPTPPPPSPFTGVAAASVEVPLGSLNDASSIWTVAAGTTGDNTPTIESFPNFADFEIAYGGEVPQSDDGVQLATISENGVRDGFFPTVESPFNHTGWGNGRYGVATSATPDGGEQNGNVAVAFFPFNDGWIGANVGPDANLVNGNGVTNDDITTVPFAVEGQPGLYNVVIPGVDSTTDGLLFTVGASNEDNLSSAVPDGNGGWRLAVRDNGSPPFSDANGFENDDFSFVYVPMDAGNLVGGYATGFDPNDNAELALSAGDFSLVRESTGVYRLSIDGVVDAASEGILLLTSAQEHFLPNSELAPLNNYLTFEAEGSDFIIQNYQINSSQLPTLADGAFYFAFVDFDNPLTLQTQPPGRVIPEPGNLILLGGMLALTALQHRRRQK